MTDRAEVLALLDDLIIAVDDRIASFKGDVPGHEFHGNQWTSGAGGSGEESDSSHSMGIAESTAKNLGVSPDIVNYGGSGYTFKVGDEEFIAAGQFDPSTGKITLYDGALRDEMTVKSVTAHEVQHAKFQTVVYDRFQSESSAVNEEYRKDDYANADKIMKPSGELRDEYKGKYPVYTAMQPYLQGDHFKELTDKDGVTGYSKAYWTAFKDGKVTWRTAVNETLSEIASLKAQGVNKGIANVWRNMYRDVNAVYETMKK